MRAFVAALSDTTPIWAVLGVYAFASIVVAGWLGASLIDTAAGYLFFNVGLIEAGLVLGALALFVWILIIERSRNPLRRFLEELRIRLTPEIAVPGFTLLVASSVLQIFYAFLKPLIPRFNPYTWDAALAAADNALFLGHPPWQVLWPALGHAKVIVALNVAYNLWFFWGMIVWTLVAFATRHRRKTVQYFLAHAMMWSIGGSLIATVFAAAGPCFFGELHPGIDPFAGLMSQLHTISAQVPVPSLTMQAALWDGMVHPNPAGIAGISAFPSLHVAGAVLRTRIAFVHSLPLGIVSSLLTAAVFLATIVLGWHYAVDGLIGGAVALGSWWAAGRVMDWRLRPVAATEFQLARLRKPLTNPDV